jgi:hypothetical protein
VPNDVVTQVAIPPERAWEPQLVMVVPPFLKLTVPPGVPPAVRVAVRVVEAPTVVGLGEDVRETEGVPWVTVVVPVASTGAVEKLELNA